jgi:hypothetical protein
VLPFAVGGALLVVVLALVIYAALTSRNSPPSPRTVAAQYGCAQAEMLTQTHFHVHVAIYIGGGPSTGQPDPLQSNLGQSVAGTTGFCWLHTHTITDVSNSIIHIEAPTTRARQGFTLADWLQVWQLTNPDASLTAGSGQKDVVYVNGQLYKGAVGNVPLKSLEDITIEIVSPSQTPEVPPKFQWPPQYGA